MLMVNSGWLGPETMTSPAVDGDAGQQHDDGQDESQRTRRSDFENRFLILAETWLKQPSLAFKIRRLDVDGVPSHLERKFHGHA